MTTAEPVGPAPVDPSDAGSAPGAGLGAATEAKVQEVLDALERYGRRSMVALAGVPATGKSHIARIAAQRFAGNKLRVKPLAFHPSYSYETFVIGRTLNDNGGVDTKDGPFLEWNELARDDSEQRYVLLIDELTRADLPRVLGEVMTYIEYRDRPFQVMYPTQDRRVQPNLFVLATLNPTDRSALEMDDALTRRIRYVDCPPDPRQLEEMLGASAVTPGTMDKLKAIFYDCLKLKNWETYQRLMPFGHGIFAELTVDDDLPALYDSLIKHYLGRPGLNRNPYAELIDKHFSENGWKPEPPAWARPPDV